MERFRYLKSSLVFLLGYIGVNLVTMGKALHARLATHSSQISVIDRDEGLRLASGETQSAFTVPADGDSRFELRHLPAQRHHLPRQPDP